MFGRGTSMFEDRADAGRQLAEAVEDRVPDADLVLAIPRGGLPLGRAVADALSVPLDIVVTSKIGAPNNPEFAIGAVASDGSTWVDDETIARVGAGDDYLEREREREAAAAREKEARYRGEREPPDVRDRTVVIVDDGVATGSTITAAVRVVSAQGAERVVCAVPVGPPDAIEKLRGVADEVVCLSTPSSFGAVGQFYRRFEQVTDEEAMSYLGWHE